MVVEMRVCRIVFSLIVFEYEDAVFFEKLLFKDGFNKKVVMLAFVRRVSEDDVIFHCMLWEEAEDVRPHHRYLRHIEFQRCLPDKAHTVVIIVHRRDTLTAS